MLTREHLLEIARSKRAAPCTWFYIILALGSRLDDGSSIPSCVVETALSQIVLWYVQQNGKGGAVSLKAPFIRHVILTYAKAHKCRPFNTVPRSPEVEHALKTHMRMLMAYVRGWARRAPDAMIRYLIVPKAWLILYLSELAPCGTNADRPA